MTHERLSPGSPNEAAYEHLHRYAFVRDAARGKTVLDLACGDGYGSNLLSSVAHSVIGVDISPETVLSASGCYQAENLEFLLGAADAIPVLDKSVDLVVSFETLEHLDKHEEMLKEIHRVLKPDGILVISTPNKRVYTEQHGIRNPYHKKELYIEEFRDLLYRHFCFVQLYTQKLVYGSLIASENPATFSEFRGDFSAIESSNRSAEPWFMIGVASEKQHEPMPSSCFDARTNLLSEINRAYHLSWRYRLGSLIVWPIKFLKSLLRW